MDDGRIERPSFPWVAVAILIGIFLLGYGINWWLSHNRAKLEVPTDIITEDTDASWESVDTYPYPIVSTPLANALPTPSLTPPPASSDVLRSASFQPTPKPTAKPKKTPIKQHPHKSTARPSVPVEQSSSAATATTDNVHASASATAANDVYASASASIDGAWASATAGDTSAWASAN